MGITALEAAGIGSAVFIGFMLAVLLGFTLYGKISEAREESKVQEAKRAEPKQVNHSEEILATLLQISRTLLGSLANQERLLDNITELRIIAEKTKEENSKLLNEMLANGLKCTATVGRIQSEFSVMGLVMGVDPKKDYAQYIHDNPEEESQDVMNELVIAEIRTQGIPYQAALANVKSRLAHRSNGR